MLGCTTTGLLPDKNKLYFDANNYRRELKFNVNGKDFDGFGIVDYSPFGYTVRADVPRDIFRGFVRSCNGTKELKFEKEIFKKKRFKTFIPVLDGFEEGSCAVEIFLFADDKNHKFGIFQKRGKADLAFSSFCNYEKKELKGYDFCHTTVGDNYLIEFSSSIKWFYDEKCPMPELISGNRYQIPVSKMPCDYAAGNKEKRKSAHITILGWSDIFTEVN